MDTELLKRIDRKLTLLLQELKDPKPLWVTAQIIIEKTGWNAGQMRTARNEGWVKFKTTKNEDGTKSIRYDANSISPFFLKR